jgi:hypothetical protein
MGHQRRSEFNRGERREHAAEWEEPLLKPIKHLKEMTMGAEAARAGKRFKHAVTALSVISYEAGQRNLYRSLASMTDVELLAALAAGNFELSLEGSTLRIRQGETSHQRARLKRSCQQPSRKQQPITRRHISRERRRSNAIGRENSARGSRWQRSRTSLA